MNNKGQMNVYDLHWKYEGRKKKPCEYSFMRYIGQSVQFYNCTRDEHWTGHIIEIFPYYTYVHTVKGVLVGTPSTIKPLIEEDFK